jgi:hypothetical protein
MDVVGLLRPEGAAATGLFLEPAIDFGDLVNLGDAPGTFGANSAGVCTFGAFPFIFFGVALVELPESLLPPLDEFRDAVAATAEFFTAP